MDHSLPHSRLPSLSTSRGVTSSGGLSPARRGARLPRPPSQSLTAADIVALRMSPIAADSERPRAATAAAMPVNGSSPAGWNTIAPRAGHTNPASWRNVGPNGVVQFSGERSPTRAGASSREAVSRRRVIRSESDRRPGQGEGGRAPPHVPVPTEQVYQNLDRSRPPTGASGDCESDYLEMNASSSAFPVPQQDLLYENLDRLTVERTPLHPISATGKQSRHLPPRPCPDKSCYPHVRPLRRQDLPSPASPTPPHSNTVHTGSPVSATEENHYMEIPDDSATCVDTYLGSRRVPVPRPGQDYRPPQTLPVQPSRARKPDPTAAESGSSHPSVVSSPTRGASPATRGRRNLSAERVTPPGRLQPVTAAEAEYLLPDGESRWGVTSPPGALLEACGTMGSSLSLSESTASAGGDTAGSSSPPGGRSAESDCGVAPPTGGSSSPPGGRSAESDCGVAPPLPAHQMPSQAWFRDVARPTAELVLGGRPDGAFLVRPSRSVAGPLALSVVVAGQCRHLTIRRTSDDRLVLGTRTDEKRFRSVAELVQHYRQYPVHVKFGGSVNATKLNWHPEGHVV